MTTTVQVAERRVKDLLTHAFEGGSNYWYEIDEDQTIYADGLSYEDFREGGKCTDPDDYAHPLEIIPFTKGCSLYILDRNEPDEPGVRLDRAALAKGLQVMADKYPGHFADMQKKNDDAVTGDVFLQCCLFGEVIFG
jgi:hypothetical protein